MTIERRSPLPIGTYWIDLIGDNADLGLATIRGLNKDRERVRILTTEQFEAVGDAPSRTWLRFEVLTPVVWDHTKLGSPTIATPSVQTSDDTVTKPEVTGPLDTLTNAASNLSTPVKALAWTVVGLVGVGGLAWVLRVVRKHGR